MKPMIIRLACRRLNAAAAPEIEASLADAWSKGATVVGLDFSDVVYVDSLGISALVAGHRNRPKGARIVFCGLNDYVREVLEITQLVRVFEVYVDAPALLAAG